MSPLYLTFDIETVPLKWDSFSESQQEYLVRGANTDEEKQKKKNEMALTPLTAQVVCIGLQLVQATGNGEYETLRKATYSVDPSDSAETKTEILSGGEPCYLCSERKVLESFWKILKKYESVHLVSFNGRNFDAPFLMLRSALLKVQPSRNLMAGTKFNYPLHTDLLDELTFYSSSAYGATKRFNFDFYARAFGLQSPKAEGIDGSKVGEFFAEGRIKEISEYCLRDVTTTWELFKICSEFLKM